MARYTGPVCRLYRREGRNLHLKSPRSVAARRVAEKIAAPPGQFGRAPNKVSTYGVQLREKQSCKRIYGILERQFRRYIARAESYRGVSGHILLQLLERRLDNMVYRAGYAQTRAQARQFVGHKHITVNGRVVNIPSYEVRVGDVIGLTEKGRNMKQIAESLSYANASGRKGWIAFDDSDNTAVFASIPARDDIDDIDVREQLIIELYSK